MPNGDTRTIQPINVQPAAPITGGQVTETSQAATQPTPLEVQQQAVSPLAPTPGAAPEFIQIQPDVQIQETLRRQAARPPAIQPIQAVQPESVAEALRAPAAPPTEEELPFAGDLLRIREQIFAQQGIPQKQQAFEEAFQGFQQAKGEARNRQLILEGKRVGLNVIRGAQAEAQKIDNAHLMALAEGLGVLESSLNAARQEASQLFGIQAGEFEFRRNMMLDNPGAGIDINDDLKTATKKIEKWTKKKSKEDAFERIYGVSLSLRPKGMSKKQYMKKVIKKAKKKAKKEEEYQDLRRSLEITSLKQSIAKAGRGTTGLSKEEARIESITTDILKELRADEISREDAARELSRVTGKSIEATFEYIRRQRPDLQTTLEERAEKSGEIRQKRLGTSGFSFSPTGQSFNIEDIEGD